MREYWILTKLQLSSMYGVNKIRHARGGEPKKQAKRSLWALVAMVFGLGWASTIYSAALAMALKTMGQLPLLLGLMAAATGALVLVFSVFETRGVLFKFGDYDTVMSWPVRVQAVVAARVTTMYAYNFVYALLLMLPAGVVYAFYVHPPVWFYLIYLFGIVTIPALPTALGAVLGTGITVLSARMRHRNLAASIGQIVLAFGIMALSFSLNSGMDNIAEKAMSLGGDLGHLWPPAEWLMQAVQGDAGMLLLGGVAAGLVLLALSYLLAKGFLAINARLTAVLHVGGGRAQSQRASGALRALYRMEWKRYTGSSLYLANTAFGYVMLLALAVVLGIVRPAIVNEILQQPAMRTAIPLIVALIVTMSATTFSAVSIEGRRLWIVKSLPVTARTWLLAKLIVSVTLAVPTVLLFTAIVGVGMRYTASEWLFTALTPIAYALLSGVFGLWLNLRLPKFDWSTEAEIVKQSAATGIGVFGGMLLAGAPLGILLATGSPAVLPVTTAMAFALAALFFVLLTKRGDERLYRL